MLENLIQICPACGYPSPDGGKCAVCAGAPRSEPDGPPVDPRRGFFLADLLRGFLGYFKAGVMLFGVPEFAGLLGVPFLINVVISVLALGGAVWLSLDVIAPWLDGDWGLLNWLKSAVWFIGPALALLLGSLILFFTFPTLQMLILAPFLDPIARRTEKLLLGREPPTPELGWMQELFIATSFAVRVFLLQVVMLLICLSLSLLFGVGVFAGILASAALTALTWFDHPLARRGLGFPEKLRLLRHNWPLALGFGLACQAGLLIPIFNLFLSAPAAAAGASMLYFRMEKTPARA